MAAPITLTAAAVARVEALLAGREPRAAALLLSVKSKGCSGLSYDLGYLDRLEDRPAGASVVTIGTIAVVVDPKAELFITGTVMDYREDAMKAGFEFSNPNEVARCGCGESFSVAPDIVPPKT